MTTSNKKRFLVFGLSFLIIAISVLASIANTPISIEQSVKGAQIQYGADRHITSGRTCTTVSWNVVGAKQVYLNAVRVAASGEETLCGYRYLPQLSVVFADSSVQEFTFPVFFVSSGLLALASMCIFGFVIYAAIHLRLTHVLPRRLGPAQGWLATFARWAFVVVCIGLAAFAMAQRARIAFGTEKPLDWDETYYASISATAAYGLGVYPYVLGYPPIPDMGGIGYFVFLYVAAYKLVGPTIIALRLVAFLSSLIALVGIFFLVRRWYGSAAGLAAVALTPWLGAFQQYNSVRTDISVMAFTTWALVLFEHALERKQAYWPYLVGFVFALGLEFHLHTFAAAFACGLLYLVETIPVVREAKTWRAVWRSPVIGFAGGYALGAILFVILNVLPYPEGFFRTAALARLSTADTAVGYNMGARMDVPKLIQTFVSPLVILPKEAARYNYVFESVSPFEALLWIVAFPVFLMLRKKPNDLRSKWLIIGGMVGGGIIFNGPHPLYIAPLLPLFIPVLASLITHGFGSGEPVSWRSMSFASSAAMFVIGAIFILSAIAQPYRTPDESDLKAEASVPVQQVEQVKARVSTDCIIAGPPDLYVQHFMQYPKFISTRDPEVEMGSTYYDLTDDLSRYWDIKRPDVIFGPLRNGLDKYVAAARYTEIAEGIWQKPFELSRGCVIRNP